MSNRVYPRSIFTLSNVLKTLAICDAGDAVYLISIGDSFPSASIIKSISFIKAVDLSQYPWQHCLSTIKTRCNSLNI